LSLLSPARERANINFKKEGSMKTCTTTNPNEGITRQDVYTRVTDRIVADLEKGVVPG
jgi:hypothetical protein